MTGLTSSSSRFFLWKTRPRKVSIVSTSSASSNTNNSSNSSNTLISVCGDGIKSPSEACDDGNTRPYDGCSSNCTIERLWRCADVNQISVCQLISLPRF
ncbi:hypothetical protein GUITHDRAFT_81797, partial [Guillardia theta CCMP2712]